MKRYIVMLCFLIWGAASTNSTAQGNSTPGYVGPDRPGDVRVTVLPESDTYLDLRTGSTFQLHWDVATNTYVRNDMQPMNIYVNQSSLDTFWGSRAMNVNNMLMRDGAGYYTVDQLRLPKVKESEHGTKMKWEDGSKIKANERGTEMKDEHGKVKANENELKMKDEESKMKVNEDGLKAKEGDHKVKANENQYKEKIRDEAKVKENEPQLKVKDKSAKVKDNGKEQKYKYDDGTKVKANEQQIIIKTDQTKTTIDNRSGEVKTKDK